MRLIGLACFLVLAGCSAGPFQGLFGRDAAAVESPGLPAPPEVAAATPLDATVLPLAAAQTAAALDTTTEADRAAALAEPEPAGEALLGTTLASLGAPTEPGIWLLTPLVTEVSRGRVTFEGRSVVLELRPSGGVEGSGSQISLAAMRLLEAPLTGIVPLQVFSL